MINILTILAIIGYRFVNKRKYKGYIIWIIQNLSWLYIYIFIQFNWQQIIFWLAFLIMNIDGIIQIKKERRSK